MENIERGKREKKEKGKVFPFEWENFSPLHDLSWLGDAIKVNSFRKNNLNISKISQNTFITSEL